MVVQRRQRSFLAGERIVAMITNIYIGFTVREARFQGFTLINLFNIHHYPM